MIGRDLGRPSMSLAIGPAVAVLDKYYRVGPGLVYVRGEQRDGGAEISKELFSRYAVISSR